MIFNLSTFCPYLFSQYDGASNAPCCHASRQIKKLDKSSFNKINSFPTMLENDLVKQAQISSLKGEKHIICKTCWEYEEVGIKSMRQYALRQLGYNTEIALRRFILDTGNVCNLSCRTCGPYCSSGWIKEHKAWLLKQTDKEDWMLDLPIKNVDYKSIIDSHNFSQLQEVNIIGGEPLRNLEHLQVLEHFITLGINENIKISYTTNATNVINPTVEEILSKFKLVQFNLSIDAVGQQFTYIRTDGDFNKVLEFIKNIRSSKLNKKTHMSVNIVFSPLNILYLDDLYEWSISQDLNKGTATGLLVEHDIYNFSIFTAEQLQCLQEILNSSPYSGYYQGLIAHLKTVKFNQKTLDKFWQRTNFTKTFKGYDIEEYLPKLVNFLKI